MAQRRRARESADKCYAQVLKRQRSLPVAGCRDFAMVHEAVQRRSGHFNVAKDARPLPNTSLVVRMIEVRS